MGRSHSCDSFGSGSDGSGPGSRGPGAGAAGAGVARAELMSAPAVGWQRQHGGAVRGRGEEGSGGGGAGAGAAASLRSCGGGDDTQPDGSGTSQAVAAGSQGGCGGSGGVETAAAVAVLVPRRPATAAGTSTMVPPIASGAQPSAHTAASEHPCFDHSGSEARCPATAAPARVIPLVPPQSAPVLPSQPPPRHPSPPLSVPSNYTSAERAATAAPASVEQLDVAEAVAAAAHLPRLSQQDVAAAFGLPPHLQHLRPQLLQQQEGHPPRQEPHQPGGDPEPPGLPGPGPSTPALADGGWAAEALRLLPPPPPATHPTAPPAAGTTGAPLDPRGTVPALCSTILKVSEMLVPRMGEDVWWELSDGLAAAAASQEGRGLLVGRWCDSMRGAALDGDPRRFLAVVRGAVGVDLGPAYDAWPI